jgi:hypothetical protein
LWDSFRRGAAIVVCAADFRIWRKPTIATAEQVALFESVTHQTPAGPVDEHSVRSVVREVLFNCQSLAGWWATTAAAAAGLFVLVRAPGRRDRWLEAAVLLALVGGTIAVLLVIALIDVTSFSSLTAIYLAPAAPLVLSCWILAPYWALRHRPVQAATE